MGNINGVPVNKGQLGAIINLTINIAEGNISYNLFKFCRKWKTISVIF